MKKSILILLLLAAQNVLFSQAAPVNGPHVFSEIIASPVSFAPLWSPDTTLLQDPVLSEVMKRLDKAKKVNTIGIVFGSMANLSLIINGGFINPEEDIEDYEPFFGILGMASGITRLILSFNTINQLDGAQKALLQYSRLPGNDSLFIGSLRTIKTAKNLSISIPVMGAGGFIFMIGGYAAHGRGNENAGDFCFVAGWVCVGAGLVTSVITQTYIAKAKKIFQGELGSLGLGMNRDGLGLSYRF